MDPVDSEAIAGYPAIIDFTHAKSYTVHGNSNDYVQVPMCHQLHFCYFLFDIAFSGVKKFHLHIVGIFVL